MYEDATKKILEDLLSEGDTDLDTDEDVEKSEANCYSYIIMVN